MLFRRSRLIGVSRDVVFAKHVSEVVGTANKMNRVWDATLDGIGLFDLGIFDKELVLETERIVLPHFLPFPMSVLPNSNHQTSIVFDSPIATPS